MEYISLIMQEHLSHDSVERLGELGTVQFTDVSPSEMLRETISSRFMIADHCLLQLNGDLTAFKRYYTPVVRRCDEMEKKLKFFEVGAHLAEG
jgi:V-type H+-transporting ATPase subunit a